MNPGVRGRVLDTLLGAAIGALVTGFGGAVTVGIRLAQLEASVRERNTAQTARDGEQDRRLNNIEATVYTKLQSPDNRQ